MTRHALTAALVAGLVLLAGCSSGLTGSPDGPTSDSALDGETTAEEIDGETGTVNMYISDERNAIGDFEHLNVTITRVGVKPAGAVDDGEDADDEDADDTETGDVETETTGDTETETADDTAESGETETTDDTATTEDVGTETETPETDEDDPEESGTNDEADSDDADEADSGEGESEWIEYEVDNRTVDLTQLQGANATKLSSLEVPNGTYEKVFVYVSDVNGTLTDGSDQRVKLPSGKLQLNSEFTIGDGEEVDFVFDITAIRAGNSGKYILKPVISESGTDVEIDDVDERDEDADDERDADDGDRGDEREAARGADLNASFDGDVVAGENATLTITQDGDPVEGATVFVDGDRAGTTDANGTYVIQVPADAEELDVAVTHEGAEAEVGVELGADDEDGTEDAEGTTAANESQQRVTVG